eukprot:6557953-Pyramimonas_sp.AAC.1
MSHLSALDGTRDNKESGSITMAEFIRKVAAAGSSLDERAKALADCAPQRPKEETYEREAAGGIQRLTRRPACGGC